jgi:hypothetical protein
VVRKQHSPLHRYATDVRACVCACVCGVYGGGAGRPNRWGWWCVSYHALRDPDAYPHPLSAKIKSDAAALTVRADKLPSMDMETAVCEPLVSV